MICLSADQCTGCGACVNICPNSSISMREDDEGFLFPHIDESSCISCGCCETVCPVLSNTSSPNFTVEAFAAFSKDLVNRENSSSGGLFTEIAKYIIGENGVVFGAGMDEEFRVVHGYTETVKGLENFRGSKYVQSDTRTTYRQVLQFLRHGRKVLYTGTPCQIAGLLSYLGGDHEELLTVNVACHGVPSLKVWRKYIDETQLKENSRLCKVRFRSKVTGWKNYSVVHDFKNGKSSSELSSNNPFMRAFIKNYSLRVSCYGCRFKLPNTLGDLTLADFWGIERLLPEWNDDKGVSLVITHSKKGMDAVKKIAHNIVIKRVDYENALAGNPSLSNSTERPIKRKEFFERIHTQSIAQVINDMLPKPSLARRIVKRFLHIFR